MVKYTECSSTRFFITGRENLTKDLNFYCTVEASSVAGPLMFSPSLTPLSPYTHTHPPLKTRLLELADRGTTVEFVKKGGGREKTSTAVLSTE